MMGGKEERKKGRKEGASTGSLNSNASDNAGGTTCKQLAPLVEEDDGDPATE